MQPRYSTAPRRGAWISANTDAALAAYVVNPAAQQPTGSRARYAEYSRQTAEVRLPVGSRSGIIA
eukprot:scaffold85179_cov33-Tisochrysis_lutea.AAC.2